MTTPDDEIMIRFRADTGELRRELDHASQMARGFGAAMTGALEGAIVRGRGLGDVLRGLALRLSGLALRAALKPLESLIGGLVAPAFGGIAPFARGGVIGRGVVPFADGGVIATPTYFPLGAGRAGLAGEAGPEAILPLSRGPDGRLGVRAGGGSGPSVVIHIHTEDAASFAASRSQVSAAIARAVARGNRNL